MATSVAFFFASVIVTWIARRQGWALSKGGLYSAPAATAFVLCIIWGGVIGLLMCGLIGWLHPHWLLKWIFGYAQGAYASIPHFGLVAESSIPDHAMPRHMMLFYVPLAAFIVTCVALALT